MLDWCHPLISAHPRLRGEHVQRTAGSSNAPGSSPLTRGAQGPAGPPGSDYGLIPAYAGSTCSSGGIAAAWRAHPRLRGEHTVFSVACNSASGSSPLTRGALTQRRRPQLPRGLIPAYAGSTRCLERECRGPSAHPRLRGEHATTGTAEIPRTGSSPLTRGAPRRLWRRVVRAGLIPAYAGSTDNYGTHIHRRKAHPRLRGEH